MSDSDYFIPFAEQPTVEPVEEETSITGFDDEAFQNIVENCSLTHGQLIAALLLASGAKATDVARRLGKNKSYVYQTGYTNPEFKQVVKQLRAIVAHRLVDQVSDVSDLFDLQIRPSASTLMGIRDDIFAKDSDRIKASLAFLDRAPRAPKSTQQVDSRSVTVQIPLSDMQNMQQALKDVGDSEDGEIIDIMSEMQSSKNQSASE